MGHLSVSRRTHFVLRDTLEDALHYQSTRRRLVAILAAAALGVTALAACSSSATDGDPTGSSTTSGDPAPSGGSDDTTGDADAPADDADEPAGTDTEAPAEPSYPVTVTAANGDVTLEAQPERIVSLSPTTTEYLYAIGAGDQVIAVDINANFPDGLPDVTFDNFQLSVEALSELDPDLVITSYIADEQLGQLDSLGIPTVVHPTVADMDEAYEQLQQLGELTGHVDAATVLEESMRTDIEKVIADAPGFDPAATYYYELDDMYYSITSDTFIGKMLASLGLESIGDGAEGAAESGGWPQLSAEYIIDVDPDYIFLADADCCGVNKSVLLERPGWSALQAVAGDRVIELDDDLASRWGPRTVDFLILMVGTLEQNPPQR